MINLFKSLFIGSLLTGFLQTATAQPSQTGTLIDTLIIQLPEMMRSNESQARLMISELEKASLQLHHRHGIIQTAFFKAWLSYRHDPVDIALQRIDSALI